MATNGSEETRALERELRLQARKLAAFARNASSIAGAGSLQTVLDRVAAEIVQASSVVSCGLVILDPETGRIRVVGKAGGYPDDYAERLQESRLRGAPLITLKAYESRKTVVWPNMIRTVFADQRFAPMHDMYQRRWEAWGTCVGVPLATSRRLLGALTANYPVGQDPSGTDIAFLTAMADQAAVAAENAQLLAELESSAVLRERQRLARELHDSVSQTLFSVNLRARALALAALQEGADQRERLGHGLVELTELTQGALAEMRELIFQLRPAAVSEEGLVPALRKYTATIAAREGLDIELCAVEEGLTLRKEAEDALFRFVQEAIRNIVKHARARHVDVRIQRLAGEPRALVVEVVDDGVGFDASLPQPGHLGLESMRERAESLGGEFVVESAPGRTLVRAVLPGTGASP